jgi:hypothetical protein
MDKPVEIAMQVRLTPEPPLLPYQRADFFQACRIDSTFAVSCFQMDYQAVAVWSMATPEPSELPMARLVARLAMDEQSFRRLRDELNRIFEKSGMT